MMSSAHWESGVVSDQPSFVDADCGVLVDLRPLQRSSRGLNSVERQLLSQLAALRKDGINRPQILGYYSPLLPPLAASVADLFDRLLRSAYSGLKSGVVVLLDERQFLPALARTVGGGRMKIALVVDRRALLAPKSSRNIDILIVPTVPGIASDSDFARYWPGAKVESLTHLAPAFSNNEEAPDTVEQIALAQLQRHDAPYVLLAPELSSRAHFAIGAARAAVMRMSGRAPRLLALRPNHLPPRLTPHAFGLAKSAVQFGDIIEVPSLSEAAARSLVRSASAVLIDETVPWAEYGEADVIAWGGRPVQFDAALARSEPTYMCAENNPLVVLMSDVMEGRPVAITENELCEVPEDGSASAFWSRLIGPKADSGQANQNRTIALIAPYPMSSDYGVPVYTRATGEGLSAITDVDLFTVKPVDVFDRQSLHSVLRPQQLVRPLDYDEIVHILYNHSDAEPSYRSLMKNGGAVILHDAQILDLLYHVMGPSGIRSYFDDVLGRQTTEDEFSMWFVQKRQLPSLFLDVILEKITTLVVHSPLTRDLLKKETGVRAIYLPVAIQHAIPACDLTPARRREAKRLCGMDSSRVSIGTFGTVQEVKGDKQFPFVVRDLLDWGCDIDFYYVGQVQAERRKEIEAIAARVNVDNRIHFVSNISEDWYKLHLVAMDVGVQTRDIPGGQVSGALLDCVAASLPTIASASLAESIEAPTSIVRRIDGVSSPLLIAHAITQLLAELPSLVRPDDAWAAYVQDRTFARYAERLNSAIFS